MTEKEIAWAQYRSANRDLKTAIVIAGYDSNAVAQARFIRDIHATTLIEVLMRRDG